MSGDLAAFLAARYDEAEALTESAREGGPDTPAVGARWHPDRDGCCLKDEFNEWVAERMTPGVTAYIAANDPARRLADVKLKRAILAEHATETSRVQVRALEEDIAAGKPLWWYEDEHQCVICGWFDAETGGCATVRQLGTEFAEHAGYKQEWRPE